MLQKSRALVLRLQPYNDSSSIVVLFTETMGCLSFLVRIPRTKGKGRSRLFQPLAQLDIEWDVRAQSSLQYLRRVEVSQAYSSLPYDPVKSSIAIFLCEFLYHCLRQEQAAGSLFSYLSMSLRWLDVARGGFANFHLVFLLRLSWFMGLYPNTEHFSPTSCFDLLNSRFVSAPPVHPYFVGASEARFLPLLLRMNFDTMQRFRFTRAERGRLLDVIHDYYRLHVPGFAPLKSLDVLRQLFDD